ncbi:la-related protein 4 isoform X1 [Oryzias latipes]|uniref:la-related protein 4 isoform X1 n=2 Tax=Oryzias latipes TaxID=8090 RepID=UPI000CE19966|nr:la-related protein 4 isoform X1 [Oryzias latipes]
MVTTKEAGLNPNAKVWQGIPVQQNEIPVEAEDSPWLQTCPPASDMTEGKGFYSDHVNITEDHSPEYDGDSPDTECVVFNSHGEPATDLEVSKEQPMTEENLRQALKCRLESCFSRENLSKDLYLISQMDSDQFVSIWTVACMEDIKALTSDTDLILDVLKASPMVQVDEAGKKVRPNHSRCVIILREIPETTPVQEVEALFQSENCPKVLRAEFAHNSNWYITFQSDLDAQQAFRYLREDVKMFQGKPIMARIKAVNTFFGKNGFHAMDSVMYQQQQQQQPPPPPPQCDSPVFMQQIFNPQQQFPVYPVVSPSWNAAVVPHFEMPLAPFPNSGFRNTYSGADAYKANSSAVNGHRPSRSRRGIRRSMRSEDEHVKRLVPVLEEKSPKFDFEASSFPPLPGSVVTVQEQSVAEVRLSDVVRGTKVTTKAVSHDVAVIQNPKRSEKAASIQTAVPRPETSPSLAKEQDSDPPVLKKENVSLQTVPPAAERVSDSSSQEVTSQKPNATPEQEPKKLSYAQVCQRPAKEPPPAQTPSPPPANPPSSQPLQELKVNTVEEGPLGSRQTSEKGGDKRPHRKPSHSLREAPARGGASAPRRREQQKGFSHSKRFPPQQGSRLSGKEQNIPPTH